MNSAQSLETIEDTQFEINSRSTINDMATVQIEYNRRQAMQHIDQMLREAEELIRDIDIQINNPRIDYQKICNICFTIKPQSFFAQFCENHHKFCHGCSNGMIVNAIQEFKIVKCPEEGCEAQIDMNSPYFNNLSQQKKEKYSKIVKNKKILQNPKLRLCSKRDCEGHYLTDSIKLQCNVCKQQHCPKCRQSIHSDPCDKLVVRNMQRKFGFRKCPQCHMVVARNEGCDHMTCLCTHQFCYKCGQSYIHGQHICTKPPHLKGFASFRWEIQRNPSILQTSGIFNLSRILYHLEPSADQSAIYRLIHIFLFSILLYPILSIMSISLAILATTLYCGLAATVICCYFIILPIMEVYNLQLKPARYLRNNNVPKIMVRMLVVPLYPINFIYGIKDKSDFISCEGQILRLKSIIKIVLFFFALPFLMTTASE